MGHGHATQFINFQQCFPASRAGQAEWITLPGKGSPDLLAAFPFLPQTMRFARHQLWYAQQAIAGHREWQALFFAATSVQFLSLVRQYRSYFYLDFSPSLMRELAPWYDHLESSGLRKLLKERPTRQLYQSATGIFTMSEWAARGITADYGVPRSQVHVTLPGANLNVWNFLDRSNRPSQRPVHILMVGSEFRRKGGELLLQWAENTRTAGWEIDIVSWPGELPGWVRAQLGNPAGDASISTTLAPRLPNVRVHCGLKSNMPELRALFDEADIFCLPTFADGSSIASLEAMAAGLPVLVGAVGGIPELIVEGKTGLLLKPGDQADLEAKLDALITDQRLRSALGTAARAACENNLNVKRQLHQILAVMDADIRQGKE